MVEFITKVRGLGHYDGPRAIASGELRVGDKLRLDHESTNPHDSNAIRVTLPLGPRKLGYLPRGLAPRIARILDANGRFRCSVSNVGHRAGAELGYDTVSVRIVLLDEALIFTSQEFLEAARKFAGVSGVYYIYNSKEEKTYIGSSADVGKRLLKHHSELVAGLHTNTRLMEAWNTTGPRFFFANVLERVQGREQRDAKEAQFITEYNSFLSGYNLTRDGQRGSRNREPDGDLGRTDWTNYHREIGGGVDVAPPVQRGCLIVFAILIVFSACLKFVCSGGW